MHPPALFLASTSPRRRELLQQLGLTFSVLRVDVDESAKVGERPTEYVLRLARERHWRVWHKLPLA